MDRTRSVTESRNRVGNSKLKIKMAAMKRNDGSGASVKKIKVPDEVNREGNVTGESGKCGGR